MVIFFIFVDDFIKKKFQRPDLWTSAQLGTGSWMSQGDMSKLRQMYQCDEGKSLCDNIQGPCVAIPLLVKSKYREFSLGVVLLVSRC